MSLNNKASVSVVILAKNEERNLRVCLESVGWVREIFVLDSFSDDATVDIAREFRAEVVSRKFDDFASHRNWAFDNIPLRSEWILMVDADELVSDKLAEEIGTLLKSTPKLNGYYVARKNMFAGKWIRHGGWYPDWQLRLTRKGKARYESRIVHEHVVLEGPAGYLENPLIHNDFKGIERYFERHNVYSSMEAVEALRSIEGKGRQRTIPAGFGRPGPGRRRYLKTLAYRFLPARPLFKFLWMYIFKLGFLDGRMGFRYCLLHAFYEYQISLKLEELRNPNSPLRTKYSMIIEKGGSP